MPLEFNVNVDAGSIETALVSPYDPSRPVEVSEFVINDSLEMTFAFTDSGGAPVLWSGDLSYTVRVALGEPGAVPPNGTFTLMDDGGAATQEFASSTSAQELEDELNALNGDTGADGVLVDVTRSFNGLYIIKRRVAGVFPLLTGDGALLSPEGTVVVDELTPGDASTKQVMSVRIVQQPFALNEVWTQRIDPQSDLPIGYTGSLNLSNLRMLQFLAGSSERVTHLEVEVTSPEGHRVTHAQQKVKIRSEVIHEATLDPANLPDSSAKYVHNRHAITALTGGDFTALNYLATKNTPVGLLAVVEAEAGKVQHYRLESGTDTESLPDVVRPLDYEAGTNEKIWKRKDADAPSQTAFIDLGTLTGAGTNLVSMPEGIRILTVRARVIGTAPFFRYIELDKDSGQIGDMVFVQIEGVVSGTGTADVRVRHNGSYPTHYALRLRAGVSTVHGWLAFIKREESSQPWYYIGGCESAEYYADPVYPISPSIPQKWYARLSSHLYELSGASSTVYTDLNLSNAFKLTLTADRTLANPSSMHDGHMATWFITQDATGGHLLSYGSNFVNPPAIDSAPNAVTMFTGVCMGGKVHCLPATNSLPKFSDVLAIHSAVFDANWDAQTSAGGGVSFGNVNDIPASAKLFNAGGTDIGNNFALLKYANNRNLFNVPADPSQLVLEFLTSADYHPSDLDYAYFGFRSSSVYQNFVGLAADAAAPTHPENWQLLTINNHSKTYVDTGLPIDDTLIRWTIHAKQGEVKLYCEIWDTTSKTFSERTLAATSTTNIPDSITPLELLYRYSAKTTGVVDGLMSFNVHPPTCITIRKPYDWKA